MSRKVRKDTVEAILESWRYMIKHYRGLTIDELRYALRFERKNKKRRMIITRLSQRISRLSSDEFKKRQKKALKNILLTVR